MLDEDHAALVRHDPALVIEALDAAFADNAHDATCVDAGRDAGREFVTVVIVFGTVEMVPDEVPATTPSGRPTVRRRTKTDRNALYTTALASCVLATVAEALAVAVSAEDVNVTVLRPSSTRTLEPIYVGQFQRSTIPARVQDSLLVPTLLGATHASLRTKGTAREVVALPEQITRELEPLIDPFESSFLALPQDAATWPNGGAATDT